MNGAKCAACLTAVLFVLFAFVVKGAKSLICHKCNSKFDSRCGDPFNPSTIDMVDCNITAVPSHLKGNEPVLCRKSIQQIHGNTRVVRDCGYLMDPKHDDQECYSLRGDHEISVTYCSCSSDWCNGSTNAVLRKPLYFTTVVGMMATAAMGFILDIHH